MTEMSIEPLTRGNAKANSVIVSTVVALGTEVAIGTSSTKVEGTTSRQPGETKINTRDPRPPEEDYSQV